jgi:hydroxyacylglutathione hydrolase
MRLDRFEVPGLAHYSYVLSSGGRAAVIDPRRDIDAYLDYAAANELEIAAILETHIHADYASGARQLVSSTGAELRLSAHDDGERYAYAFPHTPMRHDDELRLGSLRLVALHTPGHTPEHLSFAVFDEDRCSTQPVALFTGDFLLVGSLGRPDLIDGEERRLAAALYGSVRDRLGSLPEGLELYPAHGAGSLCGAGMNERPQSTLGYERLCNPYLKMTSREEFIEAILASAPPRPPYYARMKRVNGDGPPLLDGIPGGAMLSPAELRRRLDGGAVVIDLRRPEAFGGAHIPGAFNIGSGKRLAMWASWVAPYDRPIYLAGDADTDYLEARRALIRVGLDDIHGYLRGGVASWIEAGFEQAHIPQISAAELADLRQRGAFVLDVRTDSEYAGGHIPGARHLFAGELSDRLAELDREEPIYVICGSGYRSSVAASVLRRAGFPKVVNVVGGMNAWHERYGESATLSALGA